MKTNVLGTNVVQEKERFSSLLSLKIANFEEWAAKQIFLLGNTEHSRNVLAQILRKQKLRGALHERFPHVVTVQDHYEGLDEHLAWCWDQFGPQDGKCTGGSTNEFSARCPETLKLPQDEDGDYDGDVVEHVHTGVWASLWLHKTGYDYGFTDFCFQRKEHRDQFDVYCRVVMGEVVAE